MGVLKRAVFYTALLSLLLLLCLVCQGTATEAEANAEAAGAAETPVEIPTDAPAPAPEPESHANNQLSTVGEAMKKTYATELHRLRDVSKYYPGGCAASVRDFLFDIHATRAPLARDAREKATPATFARLRRFDSHTMRNFGIRGPKTCAMDFRTRFVRRIDILDEDPKPYHPHLLLFASLYYHVRLLGSTFHGAVLYYIKRYTPTVLSFRRLDFEAYCVNQSEYLHNLTHPPDYSDPPPKYIVTMVDAFGEFLPDLPLVIYGIVLAFIVVIALVFWPFVAWLTIVPDVFYHFWFRLAILKYTYNIESLPEAWAQVRATAALFGSGEFAAGFGKLVDAFLGLITDEDRLSLNGVLMVVILLAVLTVIVVISAAYISLFIPRSRRPRKPKSSVVHPLIKTPFPQKKTQQKQDKAAAKTPAAATAIAEPATAGKKKGK